jgi:hypothetical protein
MPLIDLAFGLVATSLPLDQGDCLFSALCSSILRAIIARFFVIDLRVEDAIVFDPSQQEPGFVFAISIGGHF